MAIDTAPKRNAALLQDVLLPDGTIAETGRANLLHEYFASEPPAPPTPATVASRRRRVLGRAETRAFLMDSRGRREVADLSDYVSFVKYGRELDDVSELELTLHITGSYAKCCDIVRSMVTWRQEIVVTRGEEITWGPGPIVTIGPVQRKVAHIVARDISEWLDHRVVHEDHKFTQVDVVQVARILIVDALTKGSALDLLPSERDAGILANTTFTPAGKPVDFEVKANQRTAGECLQELAGKGLNYTVIGRSLVIGGDFAFGPFGPLKDSHFIGAPETSEHGLLAATKTYVTGGVGKQGVWGGADAFYGLLETGTEGEAATNNPSELTRMARERWRLSYPPPVSVNIPPAGGLHPGAPITQDQLVPGAIVELELLEVCRPFSGVQQVTQVEFEAGNDQPEAIGVTFVAPGAPAGAQQ